MKGNLMKEYIVEKEKNIIIQGFWFLKVNIQKDKGGMENGKDYNDDNELIFEN